MRQAGIKNCLVDLARSGKHCFARTHQEKVIRNNKTRILTRLRTKMSALINVCNNKQAWKATAAKETNRLRSDNKTSEWNLAGGGIILEKRTRGKKKQQTYFGEDEENENPDNVERDEEKQEEETSAAALPADNNKKNDDPTRAILELKNMRDLLERTMCCGSCDTRSVEVEFKSCGINTHCSLTCKNDGCTWRDSSGKGSLTYFDLPVGSGSPLIERTSDYASNVLYVLSHLSVGDGGREAEKHLSFLGLPNATTMERSTFGVIQERICPKIQELNCEIMKENLIMEVEAIMMMDGNNFDNAAFEFWKTAINNNDICMSNAILPEIIVTADMGWQKRSSGRRYDSNSGHGILVGKETRLAIGLCLKSKICNKCTYGKEHQVCFRNHDGSSKAMEPQSILEMVVDLYDSHHVVVDKIVADDDSSIKAKLRYSTDDYYTKFGEYPMVVDRNGELKRRPNKGALPLRIPKQPGFLADPNHRKKTLKNALYSLLGKNVDDRLTFTKCDLIRLGKNFAFMARTLPLCQPCEYLNKGKAVLEHHFDNHEHCGGWCDRKDQTKEEREQSTRYYRCKTVDKKLYDYLAAIIARFISYEALVEVAHGSDTQVNESFNTTLL